MNAFPDTSFLCALYRKQENSETAIPWMERARLPLPVSRLVLWEFRHSARFQSWLHRNNPKKGYPAREARLMLAKLQENLIAGALEIVPTDWTEVHGIAERLSDKYAESHGNRAMDTLHLATALHHAAKEFLTFDARQRKIAELEGMTVPLGPNRT
jgi:predicted nucleic acid-binding protein